MWQQKRFAFSSSVSISFEHQANKERQNKKYLFCKCSKEHNFFFHIIQEMGNVSSTVQSVMSTVQNTAKTSCGNTVGIKQDLSVMLDLEDVNCPNLIFGNRARSASTCNLGAIADSLASASVNLSKEQTAGLGLGLNVNSSVLDRKTVIQQLLEQKCGNMTAIEQTNSVKLRGKNLTCEQLSAFNEADATQQCVINTVMQVVNKQADAESVKQKTDILGGLTALLASGPLLILGAVLLGFGLLYLLLRAVFRGGSSAATETTVGEPVGPVPDATEVTATPEIGTSTETIGTEGTDATTAAAAQVARNTRKMEMLNRGIASALHYADKYLKRK